MITTVVPQALPFDQTCLCCSCSQRAGQLSCCLLFCSVVVSSCACLLPAAAGLRATTDMVHGVRWPVVDGIVRGTWPLRQSK